MEGSKLKDGVWIGIAQVLALAVTSGDNHRYEKVTLNKDGDVYDGQRDGDPGTVYVVDAKGFDDLQKAISGIKVSSATQSGKMSGKKK